VIVLYTTPTCGFCSAAKALLERRQLRYQEIDVQRDPALRARLSREQDYHTVPMIFIDGHFIGGYRELAALDRQGRLIG
jgi:glutaredoxin 3